MWLLIGLEVGNIQGWLFMICPLEAYCAQFWKGDAVLWHGYLQVERQ
jgi:hypothetical protein